MGDQAKALDFRRMNVEELTAVIDAAEAARQIKLEEARKALIAEFRQKASAVGYLSLKSLLSHSSPRRKSKSTAKPPIKYRNPETGDTWSGRGRLPKMD